MKRSLRLVAIVVALLVIAVVALVIVTIPGSPPAEAKLIENFYGHRADYEQLRSMLLADKELRRVGPWGVQTAKSVIPKSPSEVGFPLDRYNQYLALLKQTGDVAAFRDEGQYADIGIQIWATGFAGDTRHVNLCWLQHHPDNEVASLKDFYNTPKPRRSVFRHVDGNWYLWADW